MGPMQQSSCIPFYPYTMFQNPMPKPSCQKSRKTIVTQKVLVSQSSNIVHCYWHTQKPICGKFSSLCANTIYGIVQIDGFFFHFWLGGVKQTAKNFTFCWFWLGKMHWNGLSGAYLGFEACQIQWHGFWVYTISGSLKNHNFRQKFHILLILTGKMHWNGLSGAYLGFKACQIQWHLFQVSMISGSWKIKILGDK